MYLTFEWLARYVLQVSRLVFDTLLVAVMERLSERIEQPTKDAAVAMCLRT